MLWVPQKGELLVQHNLGDVGDTTPGAQVTTGASSTAKGTPVEVFASTNFDAYWIEISAWNYGLNATATQGAMDILIGAAPEEAKIPNLLFGCCGGISALANSGKHWAFPLYIPSGSRIAVQAAGLRTSTVFSVGIALYGGHGNPPFPVGSSVVTYGMGIVPAGTAITPGASGAAGAWTQIVLATTRDHFAYVPSFQINDSAITPIGALWVEMGVGTTTEELMGGPYVYTKHSDEMMHGPHSRMPVFKEIPQSTRLVMRASNTGANDAAHDGVIHAVY
jgi:hypothetical protein